MPFKSSPSKLLHTRMATHCRWWPIELGWCICWGSWNFEGNSIWPTRLLLGSGMRCWLFGLGGSLWWRLNPSVGFWGRLRIFIAFRLNLPLLILLLFWIYFRNKYFSRQNLKFFPEYICFRGRMWSSRDNLITFPSSSEVNLSVSSCPKNSLSVHSDL